jgi:hypothetical protein
MMDAVRTYETSVNFNVTTRCYIPENTKLQIRRRENLKSHLFHIFYLHKTTQQIIPVSLIPKISFYSAAARNCSAALLHNYPGTFSLIA